MEGGPTTKMKYIITLKKKKFGPWGAGPFWAPPGSVFATKGHWPFVGWRNWVGKFLLDIWNIFSLCLTWTGTHSTYIRECGKYRDSIISYISSSLFDWSHACGFTNRNSIMVSCMGFLYIIWSRYNSLGFFASIVHVVVFF